MESITRVATTSHFLLMFGYKLFSFFFPLYLLEQGFSLPAVGYVYLLIYLPIALFAPIAGFINTKVPPSLLTAIGICGYATYSLAMVLSPAPLIFYSMQVVLGLSAACFFVSLRTLLVSARLPHPDQEFGYFYAAPNTAEALAPALGALLIWLFGFPGVFIASLLIHLANLAYITSRHSLVHSLQPAAVSTPTLKAYRLFANYARQAHVWPLLLISCVVLFVGGIYHPFFVVYLEHIGWSENRILWYGAIFSLIFIPVSYLIIRLALRQRSASNVYGGSLVFALGSFLFGLLAHRLGMAGVLALSLVRGAGGLSVNAGRSGRLARLPPHLAQPAGVVDTLLAPLGTAAGAVAGGFLLTRLDFGSLFTQAGVLVAAVTFVAFFSTRSRL